MEPLRLELYVVGQTRNSQLAMANLRRICEQEFAGRYELQIVDVLENPDAAEAANIVATPTLIRRAPLPVQRIIGDLSLTAAVLDVLQSSDAFHTSDEAGVEADESER